MKKVFTYITMLLMTIMLFGCFSTQLVYNTAVMTTSGASIYQQFEDVNAIVATKLPLMEEVDQKTMVMISKKFAEIKLDIDGESGNGEDIGQIMIRFSEYLDLYHTIALDYLTAKEILERNGSLFSGAEQSRLQLFDKYATMLHGQVKQLEDAINAGAVEKGYDMTEIMMNTGAVLKALSTVALLF